MNRVDRLQAALAGEWVDRPPFSFWYHFGLQHMPGEAVAAAHIAFARRFEPDFLKVMNDYPYPAPELLSIDRPTDWATLAELNGKEAGWGHQLQALETIVKALKGKTWVVDTVYSPWSILSRLGTRELMVKTAREHPGFLRHALDIVSRSLANYVRHAIATGIQGIYFGVTEARHDRLTPAEYLEWCAPYDRVVLDAAAGAPLNILHIHGSRIHFQELMDYPVQAVSWSHFHTGPGLARGLNEWGRPVLGGLDEESLHRQTPGSLRHYFERHSEELWLPRLILTPGCSLRPDISPYVLDAVRNGIEGLKRLRPKEGQSQLQVVLERPEFEGRRPEGESRPRRRPSGPAGPVEGELHPAPPRPVRPREDRPRRFDDRPREGGPRRFEGGPRRYDERPGEQRPRRFEGEGGPRRYEDRPGEQRPRRFEGEGGPRRYEDRPGEQRPRRFEGEGGPRRYEDRPGEQRPRRFEGEGGPRRFEDRPGEQRPRRFEGERPRRFEDRPGEERPRRVPRLDRPEEGEPLPPSDFEPEPPRRLRITRDQQVAPPEPPTARPEPPAPPEPPQEGTEE